MLAIPALERLRQENNHDFQARMGYRVRPPCPLSSREGGLKRAGISQQGEDPRKPTSYGDLNLGLVTSTAVRKSISAVKVSQSLVFLLW